MEILDTPESFEIKVPIRKYWIAIFLYGIPTIFLGLIIVVFLLALGEDGNEFPFPIEGYGYIFVFLVFLNLTMWFIFGYEKLLIVNGKIEIIKSNRIFSIKKSIDICEIDDVEMRPIPQSGEIPSWDSRSRETRKSFLWKKWVVLFLKLKILN